MKKNILVVFGLALVFGLANGVSAHTVSQVTANAITNLTLKAVKVSIEDARKIALKKVEGKIEEEFNIEEDDGKISAYVFKIRDAKKKVFEVQVDANDGKIIYAEEDPIN
jgi:uncharacterized membrane protein YkoI